MPDNNTTKTKLLPIPRIAIETIAKNPIILLPYLTLAFIQLLFLEILYFFPRYPFQAFFGPLVARAGDAYLHYPYCLFIVPKLFQYVQIPTFIFISSLLICAGIDIVNKINKNSVVSFSQAVRHALSKYVHILMGAVLYFGIFWGLYKGYGLLIDRAMQIRSESGIYYWIKIVVTQGAPYVNLFIGVVVTALFAFIYPIIMIENKKIFSAIFLNLKLQSKSFFAVFFFVLLPTLFYVPVVLLRNNISAFTDNTFPEMRLIILAISILVMVGIDTIVYTAITLYYLLKKGQ